MKAVIDGVLYDRETARRLEAFRFTLGQGEGERVERLMMTPDGARFLYVLTVRSVDRPATSTLTVSTTIKPVTEADGLAWLAACRAAADCAPERS